MFRDFDRPQKGLLARFHVAFLEQRRDTIHRFAERHDFSARLCKAVMPLWRQFCLTLLRLVIEFICLSKQAAHQFGQLSLMDFELGELLPFVEQSLLSACTC